MGELIVLGIVLLGLAAIAVWLVRDAARDRARRRGSERRDGSRSGDLT